MSSTVAFVIVAYTPDKKMLRELLLHLSPHRVIVVDNGEAGESSVTNVEVIHNEDNLGYGAGANVGIRKAIAEGARWVVVVNQDIVVSQKAINTFVEKLEHTAVGIAGPTLGSLDPKRWTTILGGKKQKNSYVSGSFIAIHRDVIEDVGEFYEPYFMYYEEVDLCTRAQKKGFPTIHLNVSGISHEESVTLGSGSAAHEYYLSRNHLLFLARCAPSRVKLYEWARLPKTIFEYLRAGNAGGFLGVRDYFVRRFGKFEGSI